jgi:hypothetical protein
MKVEIEVAERHATALQDDEGLKIFVERSAGAIGPKCVAPCFRVKNIEATHRPFPEVKEAGAAG